MILYVINSEIVYINLGTNSKFYEIVFFINNLATDWTNKKKFD